MAGAGGVGKPDLGSMAMFISYSIEVACELPAAPERLPAGHASPHVRNAILESQLVHTRLLAEFFVTQPGRDVVAADYIDVDASGAKPDSYMHRPSAGTLLRYWKLTSSEIVHFGVGRDPALSNDGFSGLAAPPDSGSWVLHAVDAIIDVTAEFVTILKGQGSYHTETFSDSLARGRGSVSRWRADPEVLGAWQ